MTPSIQHMQFTESGDHHRGIVFESIDVYVQWVRNQLHIILRSQG